MPHHIPAVYRRKAEGPDVRVIWPSPKDNSQVLKPGSYTVTGKVPGTVYDEALRAKFLKKMNYLIDTLHDLSQKSGRPAQDGGPWTVFSEKNAQGAMNKEFHSFGGYFSAAYS